MNILYWTDGFWPRIGGIETQGLQFTQEMIRRGHTCTVLAQKDRGLEPQEENIFRFDFNAIVEKRDLKGLGPMRAFLEKIAPTIDLIHLNVLHSGAAFVFSLFRTLFRAPVVVTIHTPYYESALPPLPKAICDKADRVVTSSKWGQKVMEKLLGRPLVMIPYGLSLMTRPLKPLRFDPPTALLIGRMVQDKGFDIGIEAMRSFPEIRLLIAGDGPERDALKTQAKEAHFLGPLHGEKVFDAIEAADIVLVPSRQEAFGLIALEAMRLGRVVIASNVGGLPEIVSHGKTGFLVPPNDSLAISQTVQHVLNHPNVAQEMGKRARETSQTQYALKPHTDLYEELFSQCCHCRL